MNKVKTVIAVSLSLLLTFCIIFLPQLVSGQNDNVILNNKTHWNYTARSNAEISSEQVVRLYKNNEFNGYPVTQPYDKTKAVKGLGQLFETLFYDNPSLREYMNKILTAGILKCYQNNILTIIDGRPIAFNLINVSVAASDGNLELVYEDKTKTLISFGYNCYSSDNSQISTGSVMKNLNSALTAYCENKLGLDNTEYYIQCENDGHHYFDMFFDVLEGPFKKTAENDFEIYN